MRNSAKKNSASHHNQINVMVRTSGAGLSSTDEKVKKSGSSQSLMKMQASQMIGTQMKEMQRKTLGAKWPLENDGHESRLERDSP